MNENRFECLIGGCIENFRGLAYFVFYSSQWLGYEPAIMVSVFLLKHNCVLSLQVPFAYDTEEEIENVSMFFDRLGMAFAPRE